MKKEIFQFNSGKLIAKLKDFDKVLLEDVSFEIAPGEIMAIIGETGAGKTMLAREILGVLPANVYSVGMVKNFYDLCKEPVLGRDIVYIPQNAHESLNQRRLIKKQFEDGYKLGPAVKKDYLELEKESLNAADLYDTDRILASYPFMLSGGEAQRVSIALAYNKEAKLVIADEPTNGLDEKAIESFFNILKNCFSNAGIILITHDISLCRNCDKILILKKGKVVEKGTASQVMNYPKSLYTKLLIEAAYE